MAETLFQDPSFGNTPSDIGAAPSSGVGLADPLREAVNSADAMNTPTAELAPRANAGDAMRDEFANSGAMRKIGLVLQEFGAGVQGQPSPLASAMEQRRKDKLLQLQEVKETTSALEQGVKMAQGLEGDARTQFLDSYSQTMDQLGKGLGQTFRAAADRPDLVANMAAVMPYMPEALKLKAKVDPKGFLTDIGHGEGLKALDAAKNSYYMNKATTKAKILLTHAQQLGVPDELVQEYQQNPTASTFRKMVDSATDPRVKFSPEEETGINAHADLFFQGLGMMSPKGEEAIREDKAKKGTKSAHEITTEEQTQSHQSETEAQGRERLRIEQERLSQDKFSAPIEVSVDGKNTLVRQDKKSGRVIDANGIDVTDKIAPQIKGSPLDPGRVTMALQAHKDITDARRLIFDKNGDMNRGLVANMTLPGTSGGFGTDARKAYSAIKNAVSAKYRMETGAAGNQGEVEDIAARFMPNNLDTSASANYKLDRLQEFMSMTLDQLKESYHISKETYDKAKGGSRGDRSAEPTALPADKSALVPGQDYITARGVATWNGTAFVAKKK